MLTVVISRAHQTPFSLLRDLNNHNSLNNILHLPLHGSRNELRQIQHAHPVDQSQLEQVQLETSQVKAVEQTKPLELEERLQLLKLEQALDVKRWCLEEVFEPQNVEVVNGAEDGEVLEVESVELEQIVEVDLVEVGEVVELCEVEDGTPLCGDGRFFLKKRRACSEGDDWPGEEVEGLHVGGRGVAEMTGCDISATKNGGGGSRT